MSDDALIQWLTRKIDTLEKENRDLRARLNGEPMREPPASLPENMPRVELTATQYAVAECIIEGMSSAQIAAHMGIAPSTIKTHRRAIRKALGESECEELKALKPRWFRPQP